VLYFPDETMDIPANSINPTPIEVPQIQEAALPIAGRHIPALDGIRGLAVILVVANHLMRSLQAEFSFGQRNLLAQSVTFGWIGVDLFFVLSGFLITGILFDQKTSDHYFKNFYARRALRIFPLYYGALLVILLLRAVWPEGGEPIYGWENPAWMWVYMTNIVIAAREAGGFGILDHFWSLAVEEHFYLFWPLVVFLFNRRQLIWVAAGVCITVFIVRAGLVLAGTDAGAIYVLTPLRLDSLCLGALLALLVRSPYGIQKLIAPAKIVGVLAALGIIGIVTSRQSFDHINSAMQSFGYSLLAIFFGALLIVGLTSPLRHIFNTRVLRWFGKYSYGIYVWHPIVFVLLLHTEPGRTLRVGSGIVEMIAAIVMALTVTIIITLLSWNLWENQFLKLKRYFE
jgi:peptidoglycan/LPS O-acetylase OafA/YrhL